MARHFNLGYKSPSWSSLAVGVGKTLTDARIRHYIRTGRYGASLKLVGEKKVSKAVKQDRQIRSLIEEYTS